MHRSTRALLIRLSCLALLAFACLVCLIVQDFSKPLPKISTAASIVGPPIQLPKNKIVFSESQFLKISQPAGVTFTLSDPRTVSHKEMQCLAKNVYHEARGEGIAGMLGIAQVTLNRADSQHRGKNTLCSVISDPGQFSWAGSTRKPAKRLEGAAWQQSLYVAQLALLGVRISELENSLYFHSHKIKPPPWSKQITPNKVIGKHVYL